MYQVLVRRRAVKDLSRIPKQYMELIGRHIDGLSQVPRPPDSKKLKAGAGYSLRVGSYRVLYDIDDPTQIVTIYRVKHRRDAYQ